MKIGEGGILYVGSACTKIFRNLGEVSNFIHKDEEQFEAHLTDMMNLEDNLVVTRQCAPEFRLLFSIIVGVAINFFSLPTLVRVFYLSLEHRILKVE